MAETRHKALDRLRRAHKAHEEHKITAGELNMVEANVLLNPDVTGEDVRDVRKRARGKLFEKA